MMKPNFWVLWAVIGLGVGGVFASLALLVELATKVQGRYGEGVAMMVLITGLIVVFSFIVAFLVSR